MNAWKKVKIQDVTTVLGDGLHGTPKYTEDGEYAFVNGNNLVNGKLIIKKDTKRVDATQYEKYKKPLDERTIMVSINGTLGNVGVYNGEKAILGKSACYFNVKEEYDKDFIKYVVSSPVFKNYLENSATGTTIKNISLKQMREYEFDVPSYELQRKISGILKNIDDKIETNEAINRNLEDQLKAIFIELFGAEIDAVKTGTGTPLGELIDVIDNRGKTPPLTTETFDFPIIDVGALRGNVRVVDFNNCTKFVDEDTYNNWFRSGHPKPWDILLSTVGSLAEMKIFLGEKGCIAQNVVALRSKVIAPLFLYQYLNYIRNDLVAYNIGSVQPSIKVTHIIKHPIFVPDEVRLAAFEDIAKVISDQIYMLYSESEVLKGIRDSLLPKLMSGELDVCDCEI